MRELNNKKVITLLKKFYKGVIVMKYLKIFLFILFFSVVFSFEIAVSAEYIISKSVFGNGGLVQTGDNYQLAGTLGQSQIGIVNNSSYINEIGFWYIPNKHSGPNTLVDENTLPREFKLLGNFPNPFNPTTEIRYELPEQCHVTLRIYSISGQCVATLIDEIVSVGSHTVRWTPEGLSSGLYLYSLEAGKKKFVNKMLLLK